MMYILLLVQQTLCDMLSYKIRSALAIIGVGWGTLSVVLLLSLGTGFNRAAYQNMIPLVDGSFFMMPGIARQNYQGYTKGRLVKIKTAGVMRLKKVFPSIQRISPMLSSDQDFWYRDKKDTRQVYGVSPDFARLRNLSLIYPSRFINALDIQRAAKVVVLGYQAKQRFFGNEDAIGKDFFIRGIAFKVIGVIQSSHRSDNRFHDRDGIIPYTTYINIFGDQDVSYFIVFPNPDLNPIAVKQDVIMYLSKQYHFSPHDESALRVFDTSKVFQFFKWFFFAIQLFLGLCGSLTLGVGCLSVTNLMFLVVNERTKEIGIRMAIGAKYWHIILQVLLETLVVVMLGGFVGFAVALLIIVALQYASLPDWLGKPECSYLSALMTLLILSFLGVLSGYFPARRAAKLDPVAAITRRVS